MRKITKFYLIPFLVLSFVLSENTQAQEIIVKIGERKSIQSEILHETRNIIVHLPDSYNESQSYPVLSRLDGNTELLFETIATVNRIVYTDEIAPEMIIVAVENTSRARDMWPVNN
ncbi:MAG: alpha/beta hydrolase-fold protein, partial [Bacteroidales bacterium]